MTVHATKRNITVLSALLALHVSGAAAIEPNEMSIDRVINAFEEQCQQSTLDQILGKAESEFRECMQDSILVKLDELRLTAALQEMNDRVFRERLSALEAARNQYTTTYVDQPNQPTALNEKSVSSAPRTNDTDINVVKGYLIRDHQSR